VNVACTDVSAATLTVIGADVAGATMPVTPSNRARIECTPTRSALVDSIALPSSVEYATGPSDTTDPATSSRKVTVPA
jgi:hypothetical protein